MDLKDTFANNLKRLCAREESVSAICRATKINRQQFARYLAGESVPNARNRERLCEYFGVSESRLFSDMDDEISFNRIGSINFFSENEFVAALKSREGGALSRYYRGCILLISQFQATAITSCDQL